ncbi:putative phosphate ABC transporter substrate-binding protein [Rosellinia necatrix]|uniref:Putative phosphate ABC transporter substrate-binding protein n=1 Tax=Rosellinia necatrix TaxID=77044 RepID=A0A1W2TGG7_ROSNE|nr:putative phosphate ABC transporter substrate-binding protein [Rosellinia necatrix]
MAGCIVALPMYDWPERRAEVDEQWASLRHRLRAAGVDAPDRLVRRNADMPSVPGGIRDSDGSLVAPDPATLPPDELHLHALWRHPSLLLAQTCWGPMGLGLARHVDVVGQQDYTDVEGGRAGFYSSAVVARRTADDVPAPSDGRPHLALHALRGKRLAYNSNDSMSGLLGLERDLNALGEGLSIFSERLESGGHRSSIVAVAEGRADVAAVDCLSWQLAKRFEPAAEALAVIGWTTRRRGLPFIVGSRVSQQTVRSIAVELENSSLTPTSGTQKE